MCMEALLTVLGYLYRSVNESMLYGPWPEGVAASLFVLVPGSVEISSVDGGNTAIFEFGVDPFDTEVSDVVNRRLGDVMPVTTGLYLCPEAARLVAFCRLSVWYGPIGTQDGDGTIRCAKRKTREDS